MYVINIKANVHLYKENATVEKYNYIVQDLLISCFHRLKLFHFPKFWLYILWL
jgi:hypothetical protein